MATRRCPACGAQYVASVRRCIDCEVVLVDADIPSAASSGSVVDPVDPGERVVYTLEGWGNQLKVSLEGMLDKAGIRRTWEVGALVVWAEDQGAVDSLIATVEGRDLEDLAEMEEQLAFEIEGLDADDAAELDARLLAAGIVHAWSEEGDLLVSVDDEDEVTAIVEAVIEGGDDAEEVDGLAANQALSDLYVAVDRLVNDPAGNRSFGRLVAAAEVVEPMGVPYGFAAQEWSDLKAEVVAVVALADPDGADGDEPDPVAVDEPDPADADEAVDHDLDDPDEALDADERREARLLRAAGALRERLLDWV